MTWTNLGVLYLKTDRVQLANEAFNRAHSADPQYAPAWTGQGMVAHIVGNSFEAMDHFRHSSELLFAVSHSTLLPSPAQLIILLSSSQPESCRWYAYWVCSSLRTLPLSKAVHPALGQLLPVTERAVLQARDGVEKLSSEDLRLLASHLPPHLTPACNTHPLHSPITSHHTRILPLHPPITSLPLILSSHHTLLSLPSHLPV